MKIRLKAKDSKQDAIEALRKTEEKFPNLELVHLVANKPFQYSLYNLETRSYVKPLTAETPFIKELMKQLEGTDYDLFKVEDKDQVQIKGIIEGVPNNSWKNVTPYEETDFDYDEEEEEKEDKDTRWNYGSSTGQKLMEFIRLYGRYLLDGEAKLVYKRNRGLWGPSFSYNRDDTPGVGADDVASTEMKTEIYEYIDRVFFGG